VSPHLPSSRLLGAARSPSDAYRAYEARRPRLLLTGAGSFGRVGDPPGHGSGAGAGSDGEPPDELPGFTVLGPIGSREKARDHGLVLASMNIPYVTRLIPGGFVLLVHDRDYGRAATALDRFEEENRDWPPKRARDIAAFTFSPLFAIGFLAIAVFFAWVTGPVAHPRGDWFREGTSVAAQVVSTEPWRAVTALTLHADGAHIMGNVISGTLFGTAVGRRLGPGLGALAIVASGTLGNFANAVYYATRDVHHGSIGASTAVFGAVGILAATQIVAALRKKKDDVGQPRGARRFFEWTAPVLGGLGLLGLLGASPSSDLGAHGFGFLGGIVVGFVLAGVLASYRYLTKKRGPDAPSRFDAFQLASGLAAVGIVVGAWALAIG
jgi:rhomboid protease GluP